MSNDAENSDLITAINYILLYIHIENSYFKFLLYFWANKCSLDEQKRLIFKNIKNLIDLNWLIYHD